MQLTTKVAIAKVIFGFVVSAVTLYFFIEKPGKAIFYPETAKAIQETKVISSNQAVKPVEDKDLLLVKLEKQLTHASSARGSEADRPIVTSPNGKLTLSPAITRYFEYFFTLRSEFSQAEIVKLFQSDVKQYYPEAFHSELMRLFQAFLNYKALFAKTLDEITEHDMDYLWSHAGNFHALKKESQKVYFTEPEIDGLFGAIDQQLSQPSQASLRQHRYEQYLSAKAQGLDAGMYDTETQNRLQTLEGKRSEWQERLETYAMSRDEILSSIDLDDYGKNQAVRALLDRSFNKKETMRVMALERGGMI